MDTQQEVYVVTWEASEEEGWGIIGVYSSRDLASLAIDQDIANSSGMYREMYTIHQAELQGG